MRELPVERRVRLIGGSLERNDGLLLVTSCKLFGELFTSRSGSSSSRLHRPTGTALVPAPFCKILRVTASRCPVAASLTLEFFYKTMVGATGIEPVTPTMST